MAFTMACPNFKKSFKMVFGPLRVKESSIMKHDSIKVITSFLIWLFKGSNLVARFVSID
jgi:hypothetical protein